METSTTWKAKFKRTLRRPLIASTLAIAVIAGAATVAFTRPETAHAAAPAPPAAAMDDNSVSALLALDHAMEALAARVTPAIVNVAVTSRRGGGDAMGEQDDSQDSPDGQPQQMPQGLPPGFQRFFGGRGMPSQPQLEHGIGSGVFISPDGYIVTNNHVIEGATDIRVTMTDRRILKAKLIGTDPLTDVAVIKVEGSGFASVPWGDSTQLHPGATVLAFGNPYGFRFTVTRGIVSALNRPNPFPGDRRKPGQFIQTDAAINPGNSGGPLVDARGEVIGINTFLVSPSGTFSGMGFAIPSQIVRPTVEALIRDGKVTHGFIGIGITDVTPQNAKFFDRKEATGAVVTQVDASSPGGKAGLKTGDVITQINGKMIGDAGELQVIVGQTHPGTVIQVGVERDGKNITVPVTLEAMGARDKSSPESSSNPQEKPRWGMGLQDLTPDMREQMQAGSDVHGAVVMQVTPGSPAEDAGLQRGDVIVQVNRHDVQSAAEAQEALKKIPQGQDALVLVWSQGGSTFRVLHGGDGM
jgi:serine protease Do